VRVTRKGFEVKRVVAGAVVLLLLVLAMVAASGCNKAAGTYISREETTKDKLATTYLDEVLKLDASGKYTETQVITSHFTEVADPPPDKMFIAEGTWTLDGDQVTFKPDTVGKFPSDVAGAMGTDPKAAQVGTLSSGVITIGNARYVKQ
jgi:hypothetical protein